MINILKNAEFSVHFFLVLSSISIMIIFVVRFTNVRDIVLGSPIVIAFSDYWYIFSAISSTIAVTIPMGLELLLDVIFDWKCGIDDRRERFSIILIIVVPGIIFLSYPKLEDLPFLFSSIHAAQYVGCFGAVLSICNKLVPDHFTTKRLIFVQFFFALASILSMIGFGLPICTWPNICVLLCIPTSLGTFSYITIKWIITLKIKFLPFTWKRFHSLSINEMSCLLYIAGTMLTIITLPGIAAATKLLAWEFYDLPVVLIFIYSLVGFCLFPSCVPGRIARYYHSEQIIKRATLRYLSHEIRSPLNVVCNGIMFVKQDLIGCNQEIMENLNDIEFASESAV